MGYVIRFYDNEAFVNKKTQAREKVSDLLKSIEYNHSLPDISGHGVYLLAMLKSNYPYHYKGFECIKGKLSSPVYLRVTYLTKPGLYAQGITGSCS